MVKNVQASAFVPDLTPQEVFERVYAGPEAMQRYHAECNKDPNARVGDWEDGRREVVFVTKVNAPAALTRTLGIETLTIREVSVREDAGGGAIAINSKPILDFPGGSKFTTSSALRLEPQGGGCQMRVDISCAAAGPWGLVGTIEETMAAQARAPSDGFLAYWVPGCAAGGAAPQVDAPAAPPAAAPVGPLQKSASSRSSTDEEAFFDATPATPKSEVSGIGPSGSAAELRQLSSRLWSVEAAVQQLQVERLAVQRSWATSAASFAVAAAIVGGVAMIALEYGRRAGMRSALSSAQPAQSVWRAS
jgi:hypothetical protein